MQTKHALVLAVVVVACGGPAPLKDPFGGLQAGVCLDDSECDIGRCPNACNLGQPFCTYPGVFARKDILRKCPCADTPSLDTCQPPDVNACGPVPKCAAPVDATNLRAKCIGGMCAARMTDGGIPP
jgi:hypothetical protein